MKCFVKGIGVVAPGLANWPQTSSVLLGQAPYLAEDLGPLSPSILPANERRRATMATRLVLEAGGQAVADSGSDPSLLPSVFASSEGDVALVNTMCTSTCADEPAVSPFVFHNSVHNAPAGYWSIAHGCMEASVSIAAWDGTFAAGLIESATQVLSNNSEVLLICYDLPLPDLLDPHRHFSTAFACALVLGPKAGAPIAPSLDIDCVQDGREDALPPSLSPALDAVRRGNPAARALPLLHALAVGGAHCVHLPYLPSLGLRIAVD